MTGDGLQLLYAAVWGSNDPSVIYTVLLCDDRKYRDLRILWRLFPCIRGLEYS